MASQATITVKSQPTPGGSAAPRGKKRPVGPPQSASTAAAGSCSNSGSKKKKAAPAPTPATASQVVAVDTVAEVKPSGSTESVPTSNVDATSKPPPFKDVNFMHSGIGGAAAGKKNRTWKNLKQILALERVLPWKLNDPTYYNIEAPPSLKPAKKYSDISGLTANYTDPQTKLRFTSTEEFAYIRLLPTDVVTGYLALRKATSIVP